MSKNNSYPENTKKVCTKCHEEKTIVMFNKHRKGKYEVESICKECRKAYNQSKKSQDMIPPVIIHTTKPELLKQLRAVINQIEENDKVLNNYVIGEDNIPVDDLKFAPEDIRKNVDFIKDLTDRYVIESKATDINSVRVNNVKETDRNKIIAKVAMSLTSIANIIVGIVDIDIVFYKKVHLDSSSVDIANSGPSCLIVIKGVNLSIHQKKALIEQIT